MRPHRVVITGFGAITPLGLTAAETWASLCEGKSGISRITAFDPVGFTCKIAGQVPEYRIQNYVPRSHRKAVKLMSRDIELSVIAANEALVHAGLVTKGIDTEKVVNVGGFTSGQKQFLDLHRNSVLLQAVRN